VQFLAVHGLLHLLGYDHATEGEYARMFALQDELLDTWRAAR
jgi:probable rRNA maturation factor